VDSTQQALDQFLGKIEKSAYRMAQIATRNPDDALDIVQDAMIKLVEKYAHKPQQEWRPLFYSILHSRITDYHRKKTLTSRIFSWVSSDDEGEADHALARYSDGPLELLIEQLTLARLLEGLDGLSTRQQQVFMLRTWQGFSVVETARILKCSEGSVKTHLFRATESLMKVIEQDTNAKAGS
jgi:RNA polymerase sigma-70 factor, ECF subfamily